jgi:hypothetical protein
MSVLSDRPAFQVRKTLSVSSSDVDVSPRAYRAQKVDVSSQELQHAIYLDRRREVSPRRIRLKALVSGASLEHHVVNYLGGECPLSGFFAAAIFLSTSSKISCLSFLRASLFASS